MLCIRQNRLWLKNPAAAGLLTLHAVIFGVLADIQEKLPAWLKRLRQVMLAIDANPA